MSWRGVERPKLARHPSRQEACDALNAFVMGGLTYEKVQECKKILDAVIREWAGFFRGPDGELLPCDCVTSLGRCECERPRGHEGRCSKIRDEAEWQTTHYCSVFAKDGVCTICGRPEREWLW